MNKYDIFWQTYLNLEQEVKEVAKYIFIVKGMKCPRIVSHSFKRSHHI